MEKVVIFGTGAGGRSALKLLRPNHQIVAFLDNDTAKEGTSFEGFPVLGPMELREVTFDRVCVASATWNASMYLQLCSELEIPYEKISVMDGALLEAGPKLPVRQLLWVLMIAAGIVWGAISWTKK